MSVLYVSFGSMVSSRTFGCIVMGSAVLLIFRSKLLLYSAGSGVQVVFGFNVKLFVVLSRQIFLCWYGCMYFLAALVLLCGYNSNLICIGHDLNRCSGWWYVCSVHFE